MKIKTKTIVFCDEGQEDWDNYFKREFDRAEIEFEDLQVFDSPDAFEQSYGILMFDWGGMSIGNSLLDHFTRRIYKLAEENPSRDFILLSRFTEEAYNDMVNGGHLKLSNIYSAEQWIKLMDHSNK
jgi:hypothetical protein